ncbi:MAG: tetratricopeptide (TPR) repeat protein [Planctomycetota bacterium]
MSHSPETSDDRNQAYIDGWSNLYELARSGKSFSGRERHCVFVNTGDGRFANASGVSGFDLPEDGRALGIVDWNLDGALDLWVSARSAPRLRFFLNEGGTQADWLAVRLQGTASNRDAIGARVEVTLEGEMGRRHVRELVAGDAFLTQSSKWLHFGLGPNARIAQVSVHWPSGEEQSFTGLEPRMRYRIIEGESEAQRWDQAAIARTDYRDERVVVAAPSSTAVIRAAAPIPLLGLDYKTVDGQTQTPAAAAGRLKLVSLWTSTCANCMRELIDLTAAKDRLQDAGIDLIALSADPVSDRPAARALLEKIKWPFESGVVDDVFLDRLEVIIGVLLVQPEQLALPTSLLVDERGSLIALIRGQAELEDLLALAERDASSLEAIRAEASGADGRWVRSPGPPRLLTLASRLRSNGHDELATRYVSGLRLPDSATKGEEGSARRDLARSLGKSGDSQVEQGQSKLAIETYKQAIELWPDYELALIALANLYVEAGSPREALVELTRAVEVNSQNAMTHFNLGIVYASLEELDKAKHHLETSVSLNAQYASAPLNLSILHARAGRWDEAKQWARKALDLEPGHERATATLSQIHRLHNDYTSAVTICRAGLVHSAESEAIHHELGLALASLKDIDGATAELAWLDGKGSRFAGAVRAAIAAAQGE